MEAPLKLIFWYSVKLWIYVLLTLPPSSNFKIEGNFQLIKQEMGEDAAIYFDTNFCKNIETGLIILFFKLSEIHLDTSYEH